MMQAVAVAVSGVSALEAVLVLETNQELCQRLRL
jgi:hypothetical protein